MHTSRRAGQALRKLWPVCSQDIRGHRQALTLHSIASDKAVCGLDVGGPFISTRRHIPMPELENPDRKQTEEVRAILAGYFDTEGIGASARSFRAHYCPKASFPRRSAARRNRPEGIHTVSVCEPDLLIRRSQGPADQNQQASNRTLAASRTRSELRCRFPRSGPCRVRYRSNRARRRNGGAR